MKEWIKNTRLRFYHFVGLGWVMLSVNNLDGIHDPGHTQEFSLWRFMAAWYVFVSGIIILTYIFWNTPSWLRVLAWASFGAGLMFWATVATSGWPLWVCTALGSWYMAARVARGANV